MCSHLFNSVVARFFHDSVNILSYFGEYEWNTNYVHQLFDIKLLILAPDSIM